MYFDITYLIEFYNQPLGQIVQRNANVAIQNFWPTLSDRRLLGFGYATPYLSQYLGNSERVIASMPAAQGVVHWPKNDKNLAFLAEDQDLPFDDSSIDNVLVVHGLEMSRDPISMLNEIWRILTPAGRLIVIVANRRGLWSRIESTPFGYGHPYTRRQLSIQLNQCDFQLGRVETILHFPPLRNRLFIRSGNIIESLGAKLWPQFGGLIIAEVEKKAMNSVVVQKEAKRKMRVLKPSFATGRSISSFDAKEKLPVDQTDSKTTKA